MKSILLILSITSSVLLFTASARSSTNGVKSFDTGLTITKVRTATRKEGDYILASRTTCTTSSGVCDCVSAKADRHTNIAKISIHLLIMVKTPYGKRSGCVTAKVNSV
ncbi:MAG: hypothetical protein N2B00_13670, partial [Vibrio fluvialis]